MTESVNRNLDQDRVLYLVPYAHLDTQWRWDYRTTIARYLQVTLDINFRLFERYPNYVFNFSGAIRYQMMQEYYPEAFEKLKRYAAAGRWQIAGCQVEEADAIVPSPESMIRQVLYGYHYFQSEFGHAPVDYILPDCFGFPWFQPSVLAHCGIEGFSTQKLGWQSAAGIPFVLGVWEGPDGAGVAAALDAGNYMTRVRVRPDRNRRWIRRLNENGKRYGVWADYRYYGVGDMGGAPKEPSVRTVERSLAASSGGSSAIAIHQGASDQLFRDLTAAQQARLPRYSGDLLLTQHSAGSLTSQAMIKRWNRKNELLADATERAAVVATQLGAAYPTTTLSKAWLRVLGSQMHDILPGTSLPACYDFAHNDMVVAANGFAGALTDAVAALAASMDTSGEGISVLVYNPLAFARQDVVEATVAIGEVEAVRVSGPDGEIAPSQIVEQTDGRARILFLADLPPCGAAVFHVEPSESPTDYDAGLRIDRSSLENHRYRIAVDGTGGITSIVDKAAGGQELLAGSLEYQFLRETPRIFPAWNMEWKDRKRSPFAVLGGPAQIDIVESGPVRVSLRIRRAFGASHFDQQVRLACGEAGERIEFADTIDWRETGCSLKAAFPLAVSSPEATYNWELGKIRRGNNDPAKFEVPAHQWFDLTDASGSYGVTVLEDCKYGSDKPADHILRLTLLFTPRIGPLEFMFRDQGSQDWGRHRMVYGLYGHRKSWQEAGSERQALRLNQPPVAFDVPAGLGPLGERFSFLRIDSEQVGLRAMKQAEEGTSIILRVQELWGRPTGEVRLVLGDGTGEKEKVTAWESDGCERRMLEVAVKGGTLAFEMSPFEIKTFELLLEPNSVKARKPGYAPLDLPFNVRAFTSDNERDRGGLPGGRSYPQELIPAQITCGSVPLHIAAGQVEQAVSCQGQAIALPDGEFDALILLACADEDLETAFYLDGAAYPLEVQAGEGFVGLWDRRTWDRPTDKQPDFIWRAKVTGLEPGFIKRDRIGWYTTHMHNREGNEPYAYGYMFLYALSIPAGTRRLGLPDDPRVRIFAATAAKGALSARPATALYDAWP